MREFILRSRKGPTTADFSLATASPHRHLEVVAHCIVNALFCADGIRAGVVFRLVLEGPAAPPRTIRLESDGLGSLPGLDERSVWAVLRQALAAGRELCLGEECEAAPGVWVAKASFEGLAAPRRRRHPRGRPR